MKKQILLLIALLILLGLIYVIFGNKSKEILPKNIEPQSLVENFTSKDTYYGCYWGDINQKKVGTPTDWVLVYSGTKSAQWCNPKKAESILAPTVDQQGAKIRAEMSKAGCPDEMIVDKMPGITDKVSNSSTLTNSYYIKNGKRVDISEYDPVWVSANCEVPVTEVE